MRASEAYMVRSNLLAWRILAGSGSSLDSLFWKLKTRNRKEKINNSCNATPPV